MSILFKVFMVTMITSTFINIHEAMLTPRRWCFFTNWSQYRKYPGGFTPTDVDASMCSHVSYAFAGIKETKITPFEWNDDNSQWSNGMYTQINNLKLKYPNLKTLLAVGGWNLASLPFSYVVSTEQTRQEFVSSTLKFLRDRNFDGLDLCWQYPTSRGSPPGDRGNFAELLKDLKKAFDEEAKVSGREKLILGIVIGFDQNLIRRAYDIEAIKRSTDAVTVLAYDFYTPGNSSRYVMHTSALYPGRYTEGVNSQRNVESTARYLVRLGIPKQQINIGISFYARSFRLANTNSTTEGSLSSGVGKAGPYTQINGYLAYYEVCELQRKENGTFLMADRGVSYLVSEDQWISFENPQSVALKTDFVMKEGFGGIMIWSFDMDDFVGLCPGEKKYPLLQAVDKAIKKYENPINRKFPLVLNKDTPTSASKWVHSLCQQKTSGTFQYQNSCKEFVVCSAGDGFIGQCVKGQIWDVQKGRCLDVELARCA